MLQSITMGTFYNLSTIRSTYRSCIQSNVKSTTQFYNTTLRCFESYEGPCPQIIEIEKKTGKLLWTRELTNLETCENCRYSDEDVSFQRFIEIEPDIK